MLGELRMCAGNFAPRNWAFANGQLLSIAQNSALFAIPGTTYGGDGQTNFALPDLRGRVPLHAGAGPGLSPRGLGGKAGSETHVLSTAQLPAHAHDLVASDALASSTAPGGRALAVKSRTNLHADPATLAADGVAMSPESVGPTGGGQAVDHMPPWLGLHFIVCLQGIFPSLP